MRDSRYHEGHRRQSHLLSAAGHLQGGCSGHLFCIAGGMDDGHSDCEVVFLPKGKSDRYRVLSSTRRLTYGEVAWVQQRASFARATDRVGWARTGTNFSQLSSPPKARRITNSAAHWTFSRGDFTTAFSEEGLVGQMTMPNATATGS